MSSSPQRWEILQKKIGCSLHSTSQTCWSARVESVKPVAAHLPGLVEALYDVLLLNLSAECRRDVKGLKTYLQSFDCLILASIWFKILKTIDLVNRVIQARGETIDIVSKNLQNLVSELQSIRNESWEKIWSETKIVAENIGWSDKLIDQSKRVKKRKRMVDEEGIDEYSSETIDPQLLFKRNVFYVILDEVIADINKRFESLKTLIDIFSIFWEFKYMTESEIKLKSRNLVLKYNDDLQEDLVDELQSLNIVYATNFGHKQLNPLELLNHLH